MFSEITPTELKEKISESSDVHLLDVREDAELELAKIQDYPLIHIPLNQLPERFSELPQNEDVYIICRSGGRSGQACQFLASKGYKVINVQGGMLGWAKDVDPSIEIE